MHHRLSEILEHDVIGPVAVVGERFFDVALGRIGLDPFDATLARELAESARRAFPDKARIEDKLFLGDSSQWVRGVLDVWLKDTASETPYLLQITHPALLQIYERRFLLAPEEPATARGTFIEGLGALVRAAEGPLRRICEFDALVERYSTLVDNALRQARAGTASPTTSSDGGDSHPHDQLAEGLVAFTNELRRAWRLIPWSLKKKHQPLGEPQSERLVKHDETLENTCIFALDSLKGTMLYEYQHHATPYDDYNQVVGWMTDLVGSVQRGYAEPKHVTSVGRAPSVDEFLHTFPGFQPVIGRTFESASE